MKCAIVVPYFGSFPSYFQLFLNSCKNNKHFCWLVYTDDKTEYSYPGNVIVHYTTFEELRNAFKMKLGEDIVLERPYKLCDYRPAYGMVFEDVLKGYDYWGHCDTDLLFGNLEELLLPIMAKNYDKIFAAGHLTLYRNQYENNRVFRRPYRGELLFQECSHAEKNFGFDENGGNQKNVHNIFIENDRSIFSKDMSFNCSDKYYSFRRSEYISRTGEWKIQKNKHAAYFWIDGNIIEQRWLHGEAQRSEYLYMHFQGRKAMMLKYEDNGTGVSIQPNGFLIGISLPRTAKENKKYLPVPDLQKEMEMALFRAKLRLGKLKVSVLRKVKRI